MSPRDITVTQDETFHDEPCLVAIEPVSNFILVEQYAPDRQAETWKTVMNKALSGLPVTVIQSTSDEGSSLLSAAAMVAAERTRAAAPPHAAPPRLGCVAELLVINASWCSKALVPWGVVRYEQRVGSLDVPSTGADA